MIGFSLYPQKFLLAVCKFPEFFSILPAVGREKMNVNTNMDTDTDKNVNTDMDMEMEMVPDTDIDKVIVMDS
jgi:hypothetical protein